MALHTEETRKKITALPATTGLVFELEKVAVPGRRIMFEACQKILAGKQVVVNPVLWSRYFLENPLAQGLGKLLASVEKQSLAVDKLEHEIQERYLHEITRSPVKLNPALNALLMETAKHDVKIGALSFLPESQAQKLLGELGLNERVRLQVFHKENAVAPTADCWLMTCKALAIAPLNCVALVENSASCNAALKSGLRCIAVPDEFTVFQDFGGADLVIEDLKDLHFKDLQALLHACAFR